MKRPGLRRSPLLRHRSPWRSPPALDYGRGSPELRRARLRSHTRTEGRPPDIVGGTSGVRTASLRRGRQSSAAPRVEPQGHHAGQRWREGGVRRRGGRFALGPAPPPQRIPRTGNPGQESRSPTAKWRTGEVQLLHPDRLGKTASRQCPTAGAREHVHPTLHGSIPRSAVHPRCRIVPTS